MANRSYLYNTLLLSSDVDQLFEKLEDPGNDFAQIAEGAYRLPIPWLCCFRQDDIRTIAVSYVDRQGEDKTLQIAVPCTTVEQARKNLEQSLPVFEQIAGDPALGKEFLDTAIKGLQNLPLPYLTMAVIEVFFGNDPEEESRKLTLALGGGPEAITAMKDLALYDDSQPPYPLAALYGDHPSEDETRLRNTVALDGAFRNPDDLFWHRHDPSIPKVSAEEKLARKAADKAAKQKAWREDEERNAKIKSMIDVVLALTRERIKEGVGAEYANFLGKRIFIYTQTDMEKIQLENDRDYRRQLDESVQEETAVSGIPSDGFVFLSHETMEREFKDDPMKIYSLPVSPPLPDIAQPIAQPVTHSAFSASLIAFLKKHGVILFLLGLIVIALLLQ